MNSLLSILAQSPFENRLKGLQGAFNGRKQDPADVKLFFVIMLAFAAIVVAVVAVQAWRDRQKRRAAPCNPMRLFKALLKKLRIGWKDRWLLCSMARAAQLPQPTILLLNSQLYDKHAEAHLKQIGLRLWRRHAQQAIDLLRSRAFVEDDLRTLADPADYSPVYSA